MNMNCDWIQAGTFIVACATLVALVIYVFYTRKMALAAMASVEFSKSPVVIGILDQEKSEKLHFFLTVGGTGRQGIDLGIFCLHPLKNGL